MIRVKQDFEEREGAYFRLISREEQANDSHRNGSPVKLDSISLRGVRPLSFRCLLSSNLRSNRAKNEKYGVMLF